MQKIGTKILIGVMMLSFFLLPVSGIIEHNDSQLTASIALNTASAQYNPTNLSIGEPLDLGCDLFSGNFIGGCVATLFWLIFKIVAWLASFAGHFLDFLVYYSTNSSSYINNFIEVGWGAIRDIANIFFIIALLVAGLKTILNLHGTDTKKMVSIIIVIALFINFSLFTTRVIIDASNILAKIFYNNIDTKYENQNPATGAIGQKSISVGLMDKFDPEKILTQDMYDQGGGTTLFIIITVLLIGIVLYTAYVFFAVGLLFVSRVVMLWFCMIFSPIAFISYTLPFDIPGFGHKEWWKNLLENAFLAPIFVFLLYIMVMFTGFLKEIVTFEEGAGTIQKILTVMIPFIILMTLIMKSKEMAVKYAGEMGQAITKGAAVVGALAVGGAALGGAALMRGTVGRFMKGASTGDTAVSRMGHNQASMTAHEATLSSNANIFRKTGAAFGWLGARAGLLKGQAEQVAVGGHSFNTIRTSTGTWLNRNQADRKHAEHSRHDLDEAANAVAHGKKWDELNGEERYQARRKIARDRVVRENSGNNGPLFAQGLGTRKWEALSPAEQEIIDRSATVGNDPVTGHAIHGGALEQGTTWADQHLIPQTRRKDGFAESLIQSMVTGSYDVRNLSKVTAEKHDTGFNKLLSGATSVLANAFRSSLKTTFNMEYGTSQKALFKDLGHTISEALKGAKMHVDLSHVGHVEGEDNKGGHGGGGHH